MSHVEERWLDTGSSSGRVARVCVDDAEDVESAYRRILEHGTDCQECRSPGEDGRADDLCETARQLDRAWRSAQRPPKRRQ